jgi:hypothetical protein
MLAADVVVQVSPQGLVSPCKLAYVPPVFHMKGSGRGLNGRPAQLADGGRAIGFPCSRSRTFLAKFLSRLGWITGLKRLCAG